MNHELTTLPNGLRIITAEMKDTHSVSASILVGTGSRYEDFPVNGGVSHILEHMLFKGTTKRPTAKIISEEIDAVGGYNGAYTSNDVTNYYVKVPSKYAKLGLDVLADLVKNPLLDAEELDRERNVIIQEMKMRIDDDPVGQASVLVPPLVWPNNPLGYETIGSTEVINTITRDAVADYWKQHYQPQNMVVAVAGRIKHTTVVEEITRLMGDMSGSQPAVFVPVGDKLAPELTDGADRDFSQAQIIITARALPYRHADDAAAKVMTSILGRGMSSRLFVSVRERKGLAYTVNASMQNFVDTGIFDVYAGVNPEQAEEAIEAILEELRLIRDEPVTDAELSKAKNQTSGGLAMALENNSVVSERLGLQTLLLGSVESVEDQLARFDAVTAADVQRVASELLEPARLRLVVVAPDTAPARKKFELLIKGK